MDFPNIENLQTAINALSDFLKENPWAVEDNEYEFNVYIEEDDGMPGISYIAQDITQGSNDGRDLATYLAALDPHTMQALINKIHRLQAPPAVIQDLNALGNNTVIQDTHGDIGIVMNENIYYPETATLTVKYANRYGPFTVLIAGETK